MIYSKHANTESMIDERRKAYRRLLLPTFKILKQFKMPLTSENIIDFQEALALELRITPPHWTGWVRCDKCGLSPAQEGIYGRDVSTCSFCIPAKEDADHREVMLPGMIAACNRMDFHINEIRRKEKQDEQ